jgi:hypothetical protein
VGVTVFSGIGLSVREGVTDAVRVIEGVNSAVLVPVGVIRRGVGELMIGVKVGTAGRGVGTVYSQPLQDVRITMSIDKMNGFFIGPPYPVYCILICEVKNSIGIPLH